MNQYTCKAVQVDDMVATIFDDGCASLVVRFDNTNPNLVEAFKKIERIGSWANAKSNADCPAFIRKALGLQYEHKDEQESEYMRVCDWAKRGQQQEALEGRR